MTRTPLTRLILAGLVWAAAVAAFAQFSESAFELNHPAVRYSSQPTTDRVAQLSQQIGAGRVRLDFDRQTGFLKPLLDALDVPINSQLAVFSGTSLQSRIIAPGNPRTIFFNDSVVVGWVRGGFIEIAVQDPHQGAVFYHVFQTPDRPPAIERDNRCLGCHFSNNTLGVPGFLVRSIPTETNGSLMPWLGNYVTDHRSPLSERWAGWYVTGNTGASRHLGNAPIADKNIQDVTVRDADLNLTTLAPRFERDGYLSQNSDVVALLVFDHQMRMMNLLTRIGWEARAMQYDEKSDDAIASALRDTAVEAVDYMLFVDEAPLSGVRGTSGFAESFTARGPRDSKGRSLRDFELTQRVFKYPCSYMIYSEAFAQLPAAAKQAVYARMWDVLSGAERGAKYQRVSDTDRKNIIEILRETKTDLPSSFTPGPSRP